MSALLLALTLALPLSRFPATERPDAAYERIQTLLGERRLGEAFDLLPEVEDPLLAAKARAEVSYLGRDFSACVAAAKAVLAEQPGDLMLLYRALGSALWLRDGAAASAWSERLEEALATAELTPDERAWWEGTLEALRSDAERTVEASADLERRVRFARRIAIGALAAVSLGFAWLAGRSAAQG